MSSLGRVECTFSLLQPKPVRPEIHPHSRLDDIMEGRHSTQRIPVKCFYMGVSASPSLELKNREKEEVSISLPAALSPFLNCGKFGKKFWEVSLEQRG